MPRLGIVALVALAMAGLPPVGRSQAQDIRTARVEFARGADRAEIPGTIRGDQIFDYVLRASAGQSMSVEMTVDNPSAYFNVTAPGAQAAMHIGSTAGNSFKTQIPSTGDYTVRVYLMRNAARRNETANYRISFRIEGGQASAPGGDYADGLAGGPDYWQVTGVGGDDRLNMRAGPSTRDNVTATLANGTVLRNLGCRMSGGQRWCKVEMLQEGGWAGWVAGRYLRESGGPGHGAAPAASGDALVPGTRFNATGEVPCALGLGAAMGRCKFGVVRRGGGTAVVTVFLPSGGERVIHFQSGDPVMAEGGGRMTWDRSGDRTFIEIGGAERYEIFDAVVFGG